MAFSSGLSNALNSLPPLVARELLSEFDRLSKRINELENNKPKFTDKQLRDIRDTAKRENQYQGSSTLKTWKIKDVIRVGDSETRLAVDIYVHASGDLYVPESSEVKVG